MRWRWRNASSEASRGRNDLGRGAVAASRCRCAVSLRRLGDDRRARLRQRCRASTIRRSPRTTCASSATRAAALIAEDLGSANGLFDGDSDKRSARLVLDGDRPIRIGRTYLRVRDASYRGAAGAPARGVDPRPAGGAVAGRRPARIGARQPVAGRDLGAEDRLLSAAAADRGAAAARMDDGLGDPVAHLYRTRALRPASAHRADRRAGVCAVRRAPRLRRILAVVALACRLQLCRQLAAVRHAVLLPSARDRAESAQGARRQRWPRSPRWPSRRSRLRRRKCVRALASSRTCGI